MPRSEFLKPEKDEIRSKRKHNKLQCVTLTQCPDPGIISLIPVNDPDPAVFYHVFLTLFISMGHLFSEFQVT